jgi:hypothetical protein
MENLDNDIQLRLGQTLDWYQANTQSMTLGWEDHSPNARSPNPFIPSTMAGTHYIEVCS